MQGKTISIVATLILLASYTLLNGCAPPPPNDKLNICHMFTQYPKWYWASEDAYKKWGVPESVQMAVIYQESRFNAYAKPPRKRLLWVIPWKRPTTAQGYAQAVNGTWDHYEKSIGKTRSRTNFNDAVDFIGWYASVAHAKVGVSKYNAYQLYLAYHEGLHGYANHSYVYKPWLQHVANKVATNAAHYQGQLQQCRSHLPKKPWWHFW